MHNEYNRAMTRLGLNRGVQNVTKLIISRLQQVLRLGQIIAYSWTHMAVKEVRFSTDLRQHIFSETIITW